MNFKKGDLVECWDEDEERRVKCEYFTFNDHPGTKYQHVVHEFYFDGTTEAALFSYAHCRYPQPDLKIDDPVLVEICGVWETRHFAGWKERRMMCWMNGRTSHTTQHEDDWFLSAKYRLTPPESEV